MKPHYRSSVQPEIVHENANWVVIDKPAGLDCQASKETRGSVAEWLERQYGFSGLVHRLDFGTSGLMICAKNSNAAKELTNLLQQGRIKRKYQCLCIGVLQEDSGAIDLKIEDKESKTIFKVLERFKNASLVECELETGRKHQIRIHMFDIGHPIIGDHRYKSKGSHLLLKRPALHSFSLSVDGEHFESELPGDISGLIQRFRSSQTDRNM